MAINDNTVLHVRRQLAVSCRMAINLNELRGFGGLEVACWPLVPKFAGSNPVEAFGFFRATGCKRSLKKA